MQPRTRILCCALILVAASLVIWDISRPGQPFYKGKPLGLWLEGHTASSAANPPFNSPGWLEADKALRAIGTNAIPTLLDMIRAQDPPRPILKLIEWARSHQRFIPIHYRYAESRHLEAEYTFRLLGESASNAVPDLIRIYQGTRSASSRTYAAQALSDIGESAKSAVPVLLNDFGNADDRVRFDAVSAVAKIGGDPNVVVPAFRRALKDQSVHVRWNAMSGLYRFYGRARSAVPELLAALSDQATVGNDPISKQAEDTLWHIAPEKLPNSLIVERSTPVAANGHTTKSVEVVYKGERHIVIPVGRSVPCMAQLWMSVPRDPISLYRRTPGQTGEGHFLGKFEVIGLPSPPASVNAQVLCIIADQQIILNAHENTVGLLRMRRIDEKAN